jgi:uncharacterized membrane protein SpoIIM required for sporulation
MTHSDRLFAQSKFCRALAFLSAAEWLIVIWADSKVEIAAVTIAGVAALVLSHQIYWRADSARSNEHVTVFRGEITRLFGKGAP